MRCQLAAIRCEKGDVAGNLAAHLELVADAAVAGCQLAVFPEMSLTGSANPAVNLEHLISLDHPAIALVSHRGPGRKNIAPGRGGLSA